MKKSIKLEINKIMQTLGLNYSIKEFIDNINWSNISCYKFGLSEEFIRTFADKVCWNNIIRYQTLSNEFCNEFKNKITIDINTPRSNWDWCRDLRLSKKFINEFKN